MKPEVIIFDFGNVILNLDFELCQKNLSNILNTEFDFNNIPKKLESILNKFEIGGYSTEEFIWRLQQYNKEVHPGKIVDAWNSMLLDIPVHRLDFLDRLRQEFKICLLSNTNIIHQRKFDEYLKKEHGIIDFKESCFDFGFYSHQIKLRKPNKEIFNFVQEKIGVVDPKKILFVDDSKPNIEAAKSCGWNAFLHDPSNDIVTSFAEYLDKSLTA